MIATLFYFVLALFLLITVHEWGHFIVARFFKVKVLRFSFGFGKALARWQGRYGTEYVWSLFPFGGYVKMLDESEGKVLEEERHLAFNYKPVWVRIAIVMAGPLCNFIFAFMALWLVLMIGIQSLAPIVEDVRPNSVAAKSGLAAKQEILSLDGKKISSWRDFQFALMPLLGSDKTVNLEVQSLTEHRKQVLHLPLADWDLGRGDQDPLDSLGIKPFVPTIPPIVGGVMNHTPAQAADLQRGDVIQKVNGKPVKDWLQLVKEVREHPHETLSLDVLRQGKPLNIHLNISSKSVHGHQEGFIGLRSQAAHWPERWLRLNRQGPLEAIGSAFFQTGELIKATFSLIVRFAQGKLGYQSVSGPVGIAQGAGESARHGLATYLSFLALVSISLGVLNLLPIPMLDGGHLLYYLLEILIGRPLSDTARVVGTYLGLILLVGLMILGLGNDITRLMG